MIADDYAAIAARIAELKGEACGNPEGKPSP